MPLIAACRYDLEVSGNDDGMLTYDFVVEQSTRRPHPSQMYVCSGGHMVIRLFPGMCVVAACICDACMRPQDGTL